ncbi:MAG: hypothetical protein A3J31_02180 [Candidatus Taylorbacteria bacterium RIFCSPLOWO2_02_FULL_48_16]|nr:MAG: hypothetical protein A2670_00435 [Candidatus Taylorbacteria bacterium RIFCSPHIGHO2_01_FULL_48_38]OHA40592.1 MAG: hypothetical protein A3J31_02180 [Candidatus Taylorbacteria bacterium RIFCSPLOWO2_02_FULL_48_16]
MMKIILSYFQQSRLRPKVPKLRHLPETLRAEHRRKNALSFFRENRARAKSRKQGAFFFGVRRVREAVWRGVHPFCFRSCKTRANDIISSPRETLSELRKRSDFAEAKIALSISPP